MMAICLKLEGCTSMGRLCVSGGSMGEILVREVLGRGLAGHFGEKKTLEAIQEHFYWLSMI